MESLDLHKQIEQVDNPEVLKSALFALLRKVEELEMQLSSQNNQTEKHGNKNEIISQKQERLERIRHGLTELNDRMERPYVVSAELQSVKEVLDTLADVGECNSIILEGEPGTGKTQWAYSEVGQELQESKDVSLIHVRVKDTMRAQDLLYSIDDVRRLSDAQAHAQVPDQIKQDAMSWKQKILSGETNPVDDKDYLEFKVKMGAVTELGETAKDLEHINYVDLGPLGEAIYQSGKGKKVYLVIDEIEKGREELMTGILDEIENLTFTIGETGTVVKGDKKNLRIVITTNTEDSDKIPPSFRRRSLYHFMDYPSRADIAQIVNLNFPDIQKDLLDYAISVFYQYHENPDIQKKPSTPELLAWLRVLTKEYNGKIPENIPHKEVLLKYKEDQDLDIRKTDIESQEGVNHHDGELPHFVRRALQGAKIYHLVDNVNKPDFQEDDIVNNLYSGLQNAGVAFATPVFETVNYEPKCTKEFQLIVPGVEYLGGGYYAIPEDKVALFGKALDSQVEVLPTKQKFSLVMEKNKNFTKGKVDVAGTEYEGYMTEDGKVVIKKPLQL